MNSGVLALTVYFVFFALVHSLLADPRFKNWGRRSLGEAFDRWQRLTYNILALFMMLPFIIIMSFMPDEILYVVPTPLSWLMATGQALNALALFAALRQTGISYFLGVAQLQGRLLEGGLVTDGFYCYLRNPLFFFGAVLLWLSPIMTINLLVFNVLATVYFYIGALHEERSLTEVFGSEYEDYRKRVPMILPRLRCLGN